MDPPTPETPPPPPPATPPEPPPAPSDGGSQSASPNRGIMIVLSYLWLLALIPLLTEKEDEEIQWHAKHGIVLMLAGFVLLLALSFLSTIPVVGCIAALLMMFAGLAIAVVHIVAIVKGLNGDKLIIPGVSQYVEKF